MATFFLFVYTSPRGKDMGSAKQVGEFPTLASAEAAALAWLEAVERGPALVFGRALSKRAKWIIECPKSKQSWEYRDGMGFEEV